MSNHSRLTHVIAEVERTLSTEPGFSWLLRSDNEHGYFANITGARRSGGGMEYYPAYAAAAAEALEASLGAYLEAAGDH